MKKYHIPDILTASRFLFAAIIVGLTIAGASPGRVLALFVVGELTDAIDGPLAFRWPYPDELEKRLWWRVHKVFFDITADMTLGIATLLYVAGHTYPFGKILLVGALSLGALSQILVLCVFPPQERSGFTRRFILLRRGLLYIPTIAATVILLLLKATIPGDLTWDAVNGSLPFKAWVGTGLAIGALVYYLKWDRVIGVEKKRKDNTGSFQKKAVPED
ncbi:MAG: CDP-alcohol phosphatidyltransferase family protein [Clostridiales bacterium]|nr:CDP-alcohol phosphatidyltransferase family protein [Clostridiales bacterium]